MKHAVALALSLVLLAPSLAAANRELQLPELGDTSSTVISPREERQLGREVLRLYRSRMPTSSDYLMIDYLERLIEQLLPHSELDEKAFSLVVIEDPAINAFAAPGNIIGVNTGLVEQSQNEHQLASVLAHELAHLSQRHYARRMQQQQQMSLPYYAALIGSMILAATASADAGLAAMMTTQGVALDQQLRFSRQFEREADRLGVRTLERAGMDPRAAGEMFEVMLRASRYAQRPPEFLSTHPVSQRRIADLRNRTMDMPAHDYSPSLEFHLIRARARVAHADRPADLIQSFRDRIEAGTEPLAAQRYGMALAAVRAREFEQAQEAVDALLEADPEQQDYQLLAAELAMEKKTYDEAVERLERLQEAQPEHYAINMMLARALMGQGEFARSAQLLKRYSRRRPDDPQVWYWLAEVSGLAGNILQVHEARAEYFIQMGAYSQALKQLENALKRAEQHETTPTRVALRERIRQVEAMRRTAAQL